MTTRSFRDYIEKIIQLTKIKFVSDVLWNILSNVIIGGSGVLIIILVGVNYNAEGLGVFNQALSFYVIMNLFTVWGIHISIVKYIAEYNGSKENLSNIISSAFMLVLFFSILLTFIFWELIPFIAITFNSPDLAVVLKWIIIGSPLFALNRISLGVLNGLRRMKAYAFTQSIRWLLILALLSFFILGDYHLKHSVLAFPLAELLLALWLFYYNRRIISLSIPPNLFWIKKHFIFGSKSILVGTVALLNEKIDVLMIGYFMTDRAVGIYSFGAMIAVGLLEIAYVIQRNFNPVISKLWSEKKVEELKHYTKQVRKHTYLIYTPIVIFASIIYPIFVNFFMDNKDFVESIIPFYIVLAGVYVFCGFVTYNSFLTHAGFPGEQFKRLLIALIFNIIANTLFIPLIGIPGAALATTSSFILSIYLLNTFLKRILNFENIGLSL